MKARCPNSECKSGEEKNVIFHDDGNNNIDGLKCFHLECKQCGRQFLEWESTMDEIKKAYGEIWEQYR